jgi:hemerythrin-like domain-containing protein
MKALAEIAESGDAEAVRRAVGVFDRALASHAALENEILFSTLEPHLGRNSGPLMVMRMEHDAVDKGLAEIREGDAGKVQDELAGLLGLLADHFGKEENVLFPIAEQVLDDETLCEIGSRWAELRGVALKNSPACG